MPVTERLQRGAVLYGSTPRPEIGTTPHTVVHRQNKLRLRYYAPPDGADGTTIVVVPALINRAAICDLEPDRSLVGGLAARGHDVYLVDWGEAGPEDAADTVADVVLDLLHRAVDRACRHAGTAQATVLGYCQGGTLSVIYTALRPRRVARLIALNAPVRFVDGGRFRTMVTPIDADRAFPDRLVPARAMGVAFKLLDPPGNVGKLLAIEAASRDPRQLRRALARERWLEENVSMPGAFAREFVRCAYQEDRLLAGTWRIGGERVDLREIRCPLLVVACRRDFISPVAACTALGDAVGSDDVRTEVLDIGHIGVVVGSFAPKVFYPMVDAWVRG